MERFVSGTYPVSKFVNVSRREIEIVALHSKPLDTHARTHRSRVMRWFFVVGPAYERPTDRLVFTFLASASSCTTTTTSRPRSQASSSRPIPSLHTDTASIHPISSNNYRFLRVDQYLRKVELVTGIVRLLFHHFADDSSLNNNLETARSNIMQRRLMHSS